MNIKNIKSFLNYGYFMDYNINKYPIDFSKIDKSLYLGCEEEDLVNIGYDKFMKAIENDFKINQKHVIPLSGGLDSRGVLAGLLEFTDAENIFTYTFGTPKTLDYEIGNLIAHEVGTNHKNFSLEEHKYGENELIDISNRIDNQTMLFHHPPVWEVDEFCRNGTIWSGFIGDLIAGGHLPEIPVENLELVKRKYLAKNKYVKSINLAYENERAFIDYLNYEFLNKEFLSYEEQLVFYERVKKLTAPHVLMDGYEYNTPFINNELMDFLMSVDDQYRRNEYLFIEIMMKSFPKIFKLKTKTSHGLTLKADKKIMKLQKAQHKLRRFLNQKSSKFVDPYTNYIDFKHGIRERKDLQLLFSSNLKDLKSRNIINWIDIDNLYDKHLKKEKDFSDALIVLTSLEIHLKAQEK